MENGEIINRLKEDIDRGLQLERRISVILAPKVHQGVMALNNYKKLFLSKSNINRDEELEFWTCSEDEVYNSLV